MLRQRTGQSDFRYFSLAHFIDQGRPAKEVTVARNVLAFVVNSLSRRGTIVPMTAIDSGNSIFRVRLSDLGWNAALWDELTSFYPYCLASDVAGHRVAVHAAWNRGAVRARRLAVRHRDPRAAL